MNLRKLLEQVSSTAEFLDTPINDVSQRGIFGNTPLHVVCVWGQADAVATLLEAGSDVNAIGERNETPIFSALISGSVEVLQLLLNAGADIKHVNEDGRTVIEIAELSKYSDDPTTQEFINLLAKKPE